MKNHRERIWSIANFFLPPASIPGQASELVEVDVAAGENDGGPRAGGKLDEAVEQRSDGSRGGPLDDELAALHHPDHRVEDLAVGKRHEVVHIALNYGEVDLPDAADPQAVDDGLAVDRLETSGLDAHLHRRSVGGLDADHANLRVPGLDRHGDAGDQTAAADRDDHGLDLGPVLHDFQAQRSLPRDQLLVVEGVDVGQPLLPHELLRLLVGLVPDPAVQD